MSASAPKPTSAAKFQPTETIGEETQTPHGILLPLWDAAAVASLSGLLHGACRCLDTAISKSNWRYVDV